MTDQIQKEINEAGGKASTPVKNAKAPAVKSTKKKGAAKKGAAKPAPTAKMLQAAADKASREEAKAAHKKETEAAAKKELVTFKSDAKVFINAGNQAIKQGIKSNLLWTVSAHKLRELCKTIKGQSFAAMAKEHWGVEANTATKLANAGRLINDIQLEAADPSNDGPEKDKWADNMPMMNLNCLSTIAGMHDSVIDHGIDKDIIHPRSTESEINALNQLFDKNGKKVKPPITPPSTPAAEAEDAAGLSDSDSADETPKQLIARIVLLTKEFTTEQVNELLDAIEAAHDISE